MNRKKPFPLRKSGETYLLDSVPDIDQFIPDAIIHADKMDIIAIAKGKKPNWNLAYCQEMDRLTSEAGLRVL